MKFLKDPRGVCWVAARNLWDQRFGMDVPLWGWTPDVPEALELIN